MFFGGERIKVPNKSRVFGNFSSGRTDRATIEHNRHSLDLISGVGRDILKYRKYLRNKIAKFEKYVFFIQLSE